MFKGLTARRLYKSFGVKMVRFNSFVSYLGLDSHATGSTFVTATNFLIKRHDQHKRAHLTAGIIFHKRYSFHDSKNKSDFHACGIF
jgi:hypothetical protein